MEIRINRDIESKDFKENFFYHFNKRETFTIVVALAFGGAAFLLGTSFQLPNNQVTLLMVLFACPALLIGFFKKQGLGFIDYVRKMIFLRKCKELKYISTEDPLLDEVLMCRGRRDTNEVEK